MGDKWRYQEKVGGGNPSAAQGSVTDAPTNINSASGLAVNTGPKPAHTHTHRGLSMIQGQYWIVCPLTDWSDELVGTVAASNQMLAHHTLVHAPILLTHITDAQHTICHC